MDRVVTYEQLQGFVGEIRNLRQGFVTNFFWDANRHPYWLENASLFFEKATACYILLHRDEGFDSLFYIATSMEAVAEALGRMALPHDSVIDIVSKDEGQKEIGALTAIGFEPYKRLFRMSHIGPLADAGWEKSEDVSLGQASDAPLIYETLRKGFDPLCEQLPSMQEVIDYIQRQQLLVVKDGEQLCGFIIFEIAGKTSWYLRYWYTSPAYRNLGTGAKLLKAAILAGSDTRRQQLWVISDNENAISRYEHYGFSREAFNDYVMIKRNIR